MADQPPLDSLEGIDLSHLTLEIQHESINKIIQFAGFGVH
jgi:hypothetical protein